MDKYSNQIDEVAITLYESELLIDYKAVAPPQSRNELYSIGCVLDSRNWGEQISVREVMYKMLTDKRMEMAWPALTKRASECPIRSLFYMALCTEISEIYPGPDDWSLLTPNEKKRKLDKISKLALSLCQEIANTPLDSNVMEYANHKMYFDNFKQRCMSNKYREKIDFSLSTFCKLEGDFYIKKQENLENVVANSWADIGVMGPSVSSLLQDIYSKAKNSNYESVIKRKSQVRRSYFIRKLSAFFQESFDTPLHSITAAICSVFLDEDISIEEVRSTIR